MHGERGKERRGIGIRVTARMGGGLSLNGPGWMHVE